MIIVWIYSSEFQPFSSHGTHKLIIKILKHAKKCYIFANLTKKIGIILIDLQKSNDSNYLPSLVKVNFLKNQFLYLYIRISGTKN